MAGNGRCFLTLFACLLAIHWSKGRPAGDDKVSMSGEPTHFQVDDKAAELEINANAMGVKVNAKPASLQVVSKPGTPAMAVPHPAVFVPPVDPYHIAPFYPGPIYPSPMVVGHRRTVRRRHHFFDMNPNTGNWNFKKEQIPRKASSKFAKKVESNISKKSEVSEKSKELHKTGKNPRKRQWIQQVPVVAQMVSYNSLPIRVHPLVQRFYASQAAMRDSVPQPMYALSQQTFSPWGQRLSTISPGFGFGEASGGTRGSIHRAIFLPALPGYQNMRALSPVAASPFRQPWSNPTMIQAPLSGYNGYYDPILTRDFIPDYSSADFPRVQTPTPRGLIPNFVPSGQMYPGYTPLGQLQIVSKRLTIPRSSEVKQEKTDSNGKAEKPRVKRSVEKTGENKESHDSSHHGNKATKRQFILTQPKVQPVQQPLVAYVPVFTNTPAEAPSIVPPIGRNLVLNLPESTQGTFMLNVPTSSQMYAPTMEQSAPYYPGQHNVLPEYHPNYVAMATQRSGISPRRNLQLGTNRLSLGQLTGIVGAPIVQRGPHTTLFYNDKLPSNVEDEIFRDNSVQGRALIPGRRSRRRNALHTPFQSRYYSTRDSDYAADAYGTSRDFDQIDDQGSFTERILPDGRRVFRKDHVGFGPITVEANTAESALRHNEDAIDMNLDSDKRKQIPRPENERIMDRRIEIPTPKTTE